MINALAAIVSRLSRRRMLIGAAAAGGVAIAGATWVGARDPQDFLKTLIRASLPGVTLDQPSLDLFARDYLQEFYSRFTGGPFDQERLIATVKLHFAHAISDVMGGESFVPSGAFESQAISHVRRALTLYLMNSNFFLLPDAGASESTPVVYALKDAACSNPFADLRPPTPDEVTPWEA